MPSFNLTKDDPLVAANFFLEIDGSIIDNLTSVDGLAAELETAEANQRTSKGVMVQHMILAKPKWTGQLTMKRLSPLDSTKDPLWKWFVDIRDKGMSVVGREKNRKHGSIVIYDSTMKEISRWNFFNAWPSKIEADGLDATKTDPVSETITLQYEKLERKK
jgi:phage tail-like protein